MAASITISYPKVYVCSYSFCAESSSGKTGRHAKVVNDSTLLTGKDTRHFRAGDIGDIDHHISHFSMSHLGNLFHDFNRIAGVGLDHMIHKWKGFKPIDGFI